MMLAKLNGKPMSTQISSVTNNSDQQTGSMQRRPSRTAMNERNRRRWERAAWTMQANAHSILPKTRRPRCFLVTAAQKRLGTWASS